MAVEFLTGLLNRILDSEKMPEDWRSVLGAIFKNKGDVQNCGNYEGIQLVTHTIKLWEKVATRAQAKLRARVSSCKQQYGFILKKSTTDAAFALRRWRIINT